MGRIYPPNSDTYIGYDNIQSETNNNENYVYIILTNYNSVDFQSMVIKYESWDKFINDIQDINCTNNIKGTMIGQLHHENTFAVIDFKDNFHAKYHFEDEFHKNDSSYAYLVDKERMDYVMHNKI